MSETKTNPLATELWRGLMGKALPREDAQPLQPVVIKGGKVAVQIHSAWPAGTAIGFQLRGDRIELDEVPGGVPIPKGGLTVITLPDDVRAALPDKERLFGMIMGGEDGRHLIPIRVEEHEADLLGPRVIDELQPPSRGQPAAIVRHLVQGFDYEQWTAQRLGELEELVCAEPFEGDPLAAGDDWVGWKTRNEVLVQPAPGDDALRQELEEEIFAGQQADGSWGPSPVTTAVGVLRASSVGVGPEDDRVERAAQWLLDRPQPDGRPGCWMLTDEHVRQWNLMRA